MRTYIDCIPCFYRQTIEACRMTGLDDIATKNVIDQTGKIIEANKLDISPPEMAGLIQNIIKQKSNNNDPYFNLKKQSNQLALSIYDYSKSKVQKSKDRLLTAVEMAIAGNIIDYGVKNSIDIEKELDNILKMENDLVKNQHSQFFAYQDFRNHIEKTHKLIYLADNVGETVFDRILIEEIKKLYPKIQITYGVKELPVLNDAVKSDAVESGIDQSASIISTGSRIPGTVLKKCSKQFLEIYQSADMVISKGQGNFESFEDQSKPVFYLFMAKCAIVAKVAKCNIGTINLYFNSEHQISITGK